MPFRSNFLPIWMLVFYFFECLLATLSGYNDEEWIISTHVVSSILYNFISIFFPSLACQGLCRIYIESSTRHHIFVFFAIFLAPKKCRRNYVNPGTKRPKCLIICPGAKNRRSLRKNISPLTELLTLKFE